MAQHDSAGRGGWTLLEISIVVTLVGLMLMMGLPQWTAARNRSQTRVCQYNQRVILERMRLFCMERNLTCDTRTFPDMRAVEHALPVSGGKDMRGPDLFSCPSGVGRMGSEDYQFIRDGYRIVGVSCCCVPEHNL